MSSIIARPTKHTLPDDVFRHIMSFIVDPFCLGEQYREDRKKHAIIWKTIKVEVLRGWPVCVLAELPESMRIDAPQALIERMNPRNPISYVWGEERVDFDVNDRQPNGSMIYARSWNYEAYYPDTWVPSSP